MSTPLEKLVTLNATSAQEVEEAFAAARVFADEHVAHVHKNVTPDEDRIKTAKTSIYEYLPMIGEGVETTTLHLAKEICRGMSGSSISPNYYGFVTGGATPVARFADELVTRFDQNVSTHLPNESTATIVEDAALRMLLDLLNFRPTDWEGRVLTTGATASNIIGLTCGREHALVELCKLRRKPNLYIPYGKASFLEGCRMADIKDFQILTTCGHSSLAKAASIVGLGRHCVKEVGLKWDPLEFDMALLEERLKDRDRASIVVVSCGEVNTGGFATHSKTEWKHLRKLCDTYGAWLHCDGAFGVFVRMLPVQSEKYGELVSGGEGLELADSIAGDAHKILNVPYDCGFFFCKNKGIARSIFKNSAPYLVSSVEDSRGIESPLNSGIENSRRFRGLPLYGTLVAYGRDGYAHMLQRLIDLARVIAFNIHLHGSFQLLGHRDIAKEADFNPSNIYIIVLFSAIDDKFNKELVKRINDTHRIYVSGTSWNDRPACRIAVANHQVDVERDSALVLDVLNGVSKEWFSQNASSESN